MKTNLLCRNAHQNIADSLHNLADSLPRLGNDLVHTVDDGAR